MRTRAVIRGVDKEDIYRRLLTWTQQFSNFCFFDRNEFSHTQCDEELLLACGVADHITDAAMGLDTLKQHQYHGPDWWFGYLSYPLKNRLEPKSMGGQVAPPRIRFDEMYFFRPAHLLQWKAGTLMIQSLEDPYQVYYAIARTPPHHISEVTCHPFRCALNAEQYRQVVEQIKDHIACGDVYELNYCIEFYSEGRPVSPWSVFALINQYNPAPFACLMRQGDRFMMGASPERFLRKRGNKLYAQPMKGTRRRTAHESLQQAAWELRNSEKERSEHIMIVDLMRNDLARSALPGSVQVEELFGVYPFPHLLQMISTVSCALTPQYSGMDALRYAFPPGSMTGAPKVKAMQLIDRYEHTCRGLFSGVVGYCTPSNDFDFHVVIRSLLYDAQTTSLSLHAGSAITHYCQAAEEFAECQIKARSVLEAIGITQ